jgi:hypothetical protein
MNGRFLKIAMINFSGVKKLIYFHSKLPDIYERKVENGKFQTVWQRQRERGTY